MKTPEEIEQWLIWNGAWQAFMRNADAFGIGYLHAISKGEDAILEAFHWEQTPEGAGYWEDTHYRYKEWYNSEKESKEHE